MTDSPRRARPAAASRVLAGGLSVSAAFGIVGALAADDAAGTSVPPPPTTPPVVTPKAEPPLVQVVVRVHRPKPGAGTAVRPAAPAYVVPPPKPVVRKVYVRRAPQPVTTSHGSR